MRLAIIGVDSSRPVRVARHLLEVSEVEITAIADEGDALPDGLREAVPRAEILTHPHELIGRVDAVLDLGRRASRRRERLVPLLSAGIHAFVDKPLALTRDDAAALAAAARAGGAALTADSGYRLAVRGVRPPLAATALAVSGPADPRSPWGGLAFYGIHHAQIVDELGGMPGVEPDVHLEGDVVIADFPRSTRGVPVRLRFDPAADVFALAVDGAVGELAPPPDYLERMLDDFLTACAAPVHDRGWFTHLVEPVAMIERIANRLPAG